MVRAKQKSDFLKKIRVRTRKIHAEDKVKRPHLWKANNEPDDIFFIAQNLRWFREKAGLSQQELAKKSGIGLRTVAKLEACAVDANPTVQTLGDLARAMDTQAIEFYRRRKEIWIPQV